MKIRLQDESGKKFSWDAYRLDGKRPVWILKDHDGYERALGDVWATSVPRIKMIAENYGFSLLQELS
jgi:hypothetical protein